MLKFGSHNGSSHMSNLRGPPRPQTRYAQADQRCCRVDMAIVRQCSSRCFISLESSNHAEQVYKLGEIHV